MRLEMPGSTLHGIELDLPGSTPHGVETLHARFNA
ncbi:MAG: hypothetical protein ACI8QS_002811 [Planctomycetota bacterium]